MSKSSLITGVHGRQVWDSRGRPTVEAEVRLASGHMGRGIAPAGASKGHHEAVELRDGGAAFGGFGVSRAVANVDGDIATALLGADAAARDDVDRLLIETDGTENKSRLGANACIAVSMAVAHAAAADAGVALFALLAGDRDCIIPLPEIQIFGGGAHAGRRIDIQDLMVVCPGAEDFAEALVWSGAVYRAAGEIMAARGALAGVADEGGYWPAFDSNEAALETLTQAIEKAGFRPVEQVAIALDIAASEFGEAGVYELALESRALGREAMVALLMDWVGRFPILSLEDPLGEDDAAGFALLMGQCGSRLQVVGDDLLVSDETRVRDAAARGLANTVLLKPNQRGTLLEVRQAWEAAQDVGMSGIVSARSGETEDVTIAHLAVGWGVGQFKVGSFARSERMAKWNEVLRIAEALGPKARFAGAGALRPPQ
ncbi:MAG: phosphopyruvate hydratase [Alphaproteobacteria bacterium]